MPFFLEAAGLLVYRQRSLRRPLAPGLAFLAGWLPVAVAFPLTLGTTVDPWAVLTAPLVYGALPLLAWTALMLAATAWAPGWTAFLPLWLLCFLGQLMLPRGAALLLGAFLAAGSLARAPSLAMRSQVAIFWAEAFLPWLAILTPARPDLTPSTGLQARFATLPGYHHRHLGHLAAALLLYYAAVAVGFLAGGRLAWSSFPLLTMLAAVLPVFLFFSAVALCVGRLTGRPWAGSAAAAGLWLAAFALQARLP